MIRQSARLSFPRPTVSAREPKRIMSSRLRPYVAEEIRMTTGTSVPLRASLRIPLRIPLRMAHVASGRPCGLSPQPCGKTIRLHTIAASSVQAPTYSRTIVIPATSRPNSTYDSTSCRTLGFPFNFSISQRRAFLSRARNPLVAKNDEKTSNPSPNGNPAESTTNGNAKSKWGDNPADRGVYMEFTASRNNSTNRNHFNNTNADGNDTSTLHLNPSREKSSWEEFSTAAQNWMEKLGWLRLLVLISPLPFLWIQYRDHLRV
jgi:hypothetical protein